MKRFFATAAKRTALYDLNVQKGGKMVDFCGWSMPLQYDMGILASVHHVRTNCGWFDVSHMGQLRFTGKDRVKFIESLCVGDIEELPEGHARLSLLTNEKGGVKDDCIISRYNDFLYVVVNAGCFDKDLAHFNAELAKFQGDVKLEVLSDRALIALQGPKAAAVLQRYVSFDLTKIPFMSGKWGKILGEECAITRCGYTGEDGFEVSIPQKKADEVGRALLSEVEVAPSGLGARDALRLEAGLCLYGHELDENISPIEAALAWTIGKRRREQGGFLGSDIILKQLKEGVPRKRVGLVMQGAPAREQTPIFDMNSNGIGTVTSGTFSPILKHPVAQAYVSTAFSKLGSEVQVQIRGKMQKATVSKMPFIPSSYYKGQ